MEKSLKALLNISGNQAATARQASAAAVPASPLLDLVANQSHCRTLMTQLVISGRGLPRYEYIADQATGLVTAQVTLDDGTMFHSALPCRDREEASEGAARAALEGMGLLLVEGVVGKGSGQGRRGGRGRGRETDLENKYQPWAQFSGQVEVEQMQHVGKKKQEKGNNQVKAGTDQMDIRFRNKEKQNQMQAVIGKPAFVPLQVSRKAVKSKEKEMEEEPVMPKLEEVQGEVVKGKKAGGKGLASKESTSLRGQGRGAAKRKPRIAANFGGGAPK